jgi:hypothetical protein
MSAIRTATHLDTDPIGFSVRLARAPEPTTVRLSHKTSVRTPPIRPTATDHAPQSRYVSFRPVD